MRTVARIGPQFPRWFQIERNSSVAIDGRNTWTLIVVQSKEKNTAVSRTRLIWGRILTPLDARRNHGRILEQLRRVVTCLIATENMLSSTTERTRFSPSATYWDRGRLTSSLLLALLNPRHLLLCMI
jgi:hypothetical protein